MSTTHNFKVGDKLVPISGSIPLDLTSGSAYFIKKNRVDNSVSRYTASVHDGINGGVSYSLSEADLAFAGRFFYEWEGQTVTGQTLTEPSGGYFYINVYSDLDPVDGIYKYNSLTVTSVTHAETASYALNIGITRIDGGYADTIF